VWNEGSIITYSRDQADVYFSVCKSLIHSALDFYSAILAAFVLFSFELRADWPPGTPVLALLDVLAILVG